MAHVTIQCRLIASRDTRQFLWELMAQKNTPLKWLDTLIIASATTSIDQTEANTWFSILKQNHTSIPYPILYETNEDLKWSLNEKNRLSIRFSGLGEHSFQISCGQA